jgi:hypothetical protein
MRRVTRPFLLLLAGLLATRPAAGGEGEAPQGAPPAENSSYVPEDAQALHDEMTAAEGAAARGQWPAAVRALQRLVEGSAEAVWPAGEAGVYEGAAVTAHLRVVRGGAAAVAAYEEETRSVANALLEAALARRDPTLLERVADLYLPSVTGRRAALLLADLALEAGDVDAALGWLERLEDLEEASAPDLARVTARWRTARLDRIAVALARDEASRTRVRAALEAGREPAPDDLRAAADPSDWPTAGGDASRARPAPPTPDGLVFRAVEKWREDTETGPEADAQGKGRGARPSPWLPPRAVVAGGRVIASDGRDLRVHDAATGRLLATSALREGDVTVPGAGERGAAARLRWGWIEGHGLTVAGDVVYAAVAAPWDAPQGDPDVAMGWRPRGAAEPRPARDDHVVAFRLEGTALRRLWRAGGRVPTPGLPEGLGLHGTPLLYAGALHVAGLRPTKSSKDRFEAWHVALDPATGAVRSATFLGAGGPIRRARDEEAVPSSCAGARGRVVLVTALGVAAAVDARTGRARWSLRYDRGRPDGDEVGRRLVDASETPGRASSLSNQPPRLAADRVVVAPTDARTILGLFDRPRGPKRLLRAWTVHRTDAFRDMAAEQVAGIVPGTGAAPATVVVVGQGYVTDPLSDTCTCVAGLDLSTGVLRWARALPFGGEQEPFGDALVTRDEVLVPTARGIARFATADGAERPAIDATAIPAARLRALREDEMVYGNLVPVPGAGLVAVNADGVAFWLREPR